VCSALVACGCVRVATPRPAEAPATIAPLSPVVASMPASAETSIESVGAYLREHAPAPMERLKAVHDWVADRVAYDGPAATGPTPPDDAEPAGVFAGRKAVCEGYARLVAAIGHAAGLDVAYVLGVARLGDGTLALHAWNEARIGGRLLPLDVTWDSGTVDDARVFHKAYSTRYLFAAPATFGGDHLSLAQVATSFRMGCDARTADLCLQVAQIYDTGGVVAKDPELAATIYQAACDAGRPAGCNDAGAMYALGRGVPLDFARASALFRTACDGGEKAGCTNFDLVSMVLPDG
jgi:Transglutaminase-like superfamily